MSLSNNPEIIGLLNRANDDAATLLLLGLADYPFGQHAQAAIEKYLKALCIEVGVRYPRIHDLNELRQLLLDAGENIPKCDISLSLLSLFASRLRYEDDASVSLDRDKCLKAVETIRDFVEMRIKQLNS
jgi:HEPN domain-containing protein